MFRSLLLCLAFIAGLSQAYDADICVDDTSYASSGSLASPNFGNGNYDNWLNCWFTIDLSGDPNVIAIKITFTDFNVEDHASCNYDNVTIVGTGTFCGLTVPDVQLVKGNTATVDFITDHSVVCPGFRLEWEAIVECDICEFDSSTNPSGYLNSPNWPEDYNNCPVTPCGADCCFDINLGPEVGAIDITFYHFDVEDHEHCSYDNLNVAGTKYCGYDLPAPVRVSGNTVNICWWYDHSVTKKGFLLGWEAVPATTPAPTTTTTPIPGGTCPQEGRKADPFCEPCFGNPAEAYNFINDVNNQGNWFATRDWNSGNSNPLTQEVAFHFVHTGCPGDVNWTLTFSSSHYDIGQSSNIQSTSNPHCLWGNRLVAEVGNVNGGYDYVESACNPYVGVLTPGSWNIYFTQQAPANGMITFDMDNRLRWLPSSEDYGSYEGYRVLIKWACVMGGGGGD